MNMNLGPGESEAGPWRIEPIEVFARSLPLSASPAVR